MSDSYYIDEIRATRERIAKDCDYDLKKILERVHARAAKIACAGRLLEKNA